MKNIENILTNFAVGFYGFALIIDTDLQLLKYKSIGFFGMIVVASSIRVIKYIKQQ
jgi:hypothetical protein